MLDFGYPFYGQTVGVLVFNGTSPRAVGDPGNSKTFTFDVCYEIVSGKFTDLIEGTDYIKNNLTDAAWRLRDKGVKAIVGDCGLMSLYQRYMADNLDIPFVASSLTLINFIIGIIKENSKIGVITGHAGMLTESHFINSGINCPDRIVIQGMEEEEHFTEIVIKGGKNLDLLKMKRDVISAADKLLGKNKNISAILLECSNLATYSYHINQRFGLPVFDINSAISLVHSSISPTEYINK